MTALTLSRVHCTQYQQCLLKWLRQDDRVKLTGMMASVRVNGDMCCQDQQRAFWWVAGGLLNCVLHDGVAAGIERQESPQPHRPEDAFPAGKKRVR